VIPSPLTDPSLAALPGIRHGFFTRIGGVSDGIYASLNCGLGSADDGAKVAANRARVANAVGLDADRLVTPYQVHGIVTVVVDAPWQNDARPKADALVTNRTGIAIGVGTADCGPVLLADPQARIVGAAHAGWRGALAGVLESAIAAMEKLGARRERVFAALGPAIGQANYEVGPEVAAKFIAADRGNTRFFAPSGRDDRSLFDLPGYIVARLQRAGVSAASVNVCTYGDEERFFSFRRATHRGEKDYGRQLSVIVLEA
jgi:purine-nucleoside/S-methyl-5'-thioadenosine phosphorylase / adenosine deaminase